MKAVIFDFDGLILDTETPLYQGFREIYHEYGLELPMEIYSKYVGTSNDPLQELRDSNLVKRADLDKYFLEKLEGLMMDISIRPGVEDYLQAAKRLGLKIGLASSSRRGWVEPRLEQHGLLPYFDCIRTSENVQKTKPDPELYLQALELLGVSARDAIAFEDSPNGARAAKAAGMHCVIVPNDITSSLTFDQYDRKLQSMAEVGLEELIRSFA